MREFKVIGNDAQRSSRIVVKYGGGPFVVRGNVVSPERTARQSINLASGNIALSSALAKTENPGAALVTSKRNRTSS